jgi:hypothetical protein
LKRADRFSELFAGADEIRCRLRAPASGTGRCARGQRNNGASRPFGGYPGYFRIGSDEMVVEGKHSHVRAQIGALLLLDREVRGGGVLRVQHEPADTVRTVRSKQDTLRGNESQNGDRRATEPPASGLADGTHVGILREYGNRGRAGGEFGEQ